MTREEARQLAINEIYSHKIVVMELATGMGKSKIAIDTANYLLSKRSKLKTLLLVDKEVHKGNWKDECDKWGLSDKVEVTTICYASLHTLKNTTWDFIIADEAHHLYTENRMQSFKTLTYDKCIMLSATIGRDFKYILKRNKAAFITCNLQDAIDDNVLPTPRIILIPLSFNNAVRDTIIKHPKSELPPIKCTFEERFKYLKLPNPIHISCTLRQKYQDISSMVEFYKKKHMEPQMLRQAGERLKWLSELKEDYVLLLLKDLKNRRTLTFCSSIAQTEKLGKHCINSKNKKAQESLELFNNKKIKHITSCQMLNEGVNLSDCQIGIYCNINASERINKQKFGRILRHKKPVIIIPYWKYTREQELVEAMTKEYEQEYIEICKDGKIKL